MRIMAFPQAMFILIVAGALFYHAFINSNPVPTLRILGKVKQNQDKQIAHNSNQMSDAYRLALRTLARSERATTPAEISYHEPIAHHPEFFNDLTIKGPMIDAYDGNQYYDVTFPGYWFDYSSIILKHWQTNLPDGIQPTYSYLHPQIFLNGRTNNPYNAKWIKKGYWTDSKDTESLWTVGVTEKMWRMPWCYLYSNLINPEGMTAGVGYIAVYKLKDNDSKCETINTDKIGEMTPPALREANYVIGRIGYFGSYKYKYPDAYIFTQAAQRGYCQLDIIRVYRIHFKDHGCMLHFGRLSMPEECCILHKTPMRCRLIKPH